jgi:hypothetical protein
MNLLCRLLRRLSRLRDGEFVTFWIVFQKEISGQSATVQEEDDDDDDDQRDEISDENNDINL